MGKLLKGIPASPGIAIGKVYLYKEKELFINTGEALNLEIEKDKLLYGRELTKKQILTIRDKIVENLGEDKAKIFDGHITLLEDEDLFDEVIERIEDEDITAEYALEQGINSYYEVLSSLDDAYLRERASDLKDIGRRWLYNITGTEIADLSDLPDESIIVTEEIRPSDTAQLDLEHTKAFVTAVGGKTSHSSIMARSLGIPAVVGAGYICGDVETGMDIIVDSIEGIVIIEPTDEELRLYKEKRAKFLREQERLKELRDKDAVSKDGTKISTWANIGSPKDIQGALRNGAQGIGLYRTEFLFMSQDRFPTEDEQFEAYKIVAEQLKGKPVTIRTMDIGGDKSLPYLELPKEDNPFLGCRAIRVSLKRPKILKIQMRALLRASSFGYIKIMLPMVISLDEVRQARKILEECKEELRQENIKFDENIQLGIMVETPAVCFRAKSFAKECDFFSIGTNDLTQYVLAVDRGNEKVSHLYNSFDPAVLEAVKAAIDGAHAGGISISMCGEFASDKNATAILFGMGLDAFSMSALSVPRIKKNIMTLDKKECEKLVERALEQSTAQEVLEIVAEFNKKVYNK